MYPTWKGITRARIFRRFMLICNLGIHSFCSQPYTRSIAYSQARSPHKRSGASSSSIEQHLFAIICLRILSCHPVAPVFPSVFISVACFRRQFPLKMWPIPLNRICCKFVSSLASLLVIQINLYNTEWLGDFCVGKDLVWRGCGII